MTETGFRDILLQMKTESWDSMEYITKGLAPAKVLEIFEQICSIPHGSGNLDAITDFCEKFARDRHLEVIRDEAHNLIIKKPATAGYENAEPVIIQGHTDMVCEQAADCKKDMSAEGLDLCLDGDMLYAKGTTLGGDDGVAVAMGLALLDASDISHPALEVLLTSDEEIGMLGAEKLDCSPISSRRMLNLDSEDEGVFTAGCAGGNRTECVIPVAREKFDGTALKVTVNGLRGGHSGEMINRGRANSSVLLGRALVQVENACDMRVIRVDGGLKDNAIPVESVGIIIVSDEQKARVALEKFGEDLKNEYRTPDPDVRLGVEAAETSEIPMTEADSEKILTLLTCMPNGLIELSMDVAGLAQTSLNLGILTTSSDRVTASFCVRSSVSSQKEMLKQRLTRMTSLLGGTISCSGEYPAWEFRPDSPILSLCAEVYEKKFGKKPTVTAIHGGLECGLFAEKMKGLDCVSFGPDIFDIHTPRERLSISSLNRTWEFLLDILREMK